MSSASSDDWIEVISRGPVGGFCLLNLVLDHQNVFHDQVVEVGAEEQVERVGGRQAIGSARRSIKVLSTTAYPVRRSSSRISR